MNRSRAIAAGSSVGALIVLTAGVAVANPGTHAAPPTPASNSSSAPNASAGNDPGGDTGWLTPNDAASGSTWTPSRPDTGSGTFDPGSGGGGTRSGGS